MRESALKVLAKLKICGMHPLEGLASEKLIILSDMPNEKKNRGLLHTSPGLKGCRYELCSFFFLFFLNITIIRFFLILGLFRFDLLVIRISGSP
jgi:hypothetical protein